MVSQYAHQDFYRDIAGNSSTDKIGQATVLRRHRSEIDGAPM